MHRHSCRRAFGVMIAALALASLACSLNSLTGDSSSGSDDDRPLVALLAPVNGSVYAEGAVVQLYAIAQDSLSGVTRIVLSVDNAPVGEIASPQADGQASLEGIVEWTATGRTRHLITAEGFRANGSSLGLSDAAVSVVGRPAEQATANALALTPSTADVTTIPAPDLPSPDASAPQATDQPTTPSATPGAPANVTGNGVLAIVNTPDLNVRQGPGTAYPTVGTLDQGATIEIVGRNADSSWWAITFESGTAWVFATLVNPQSDTSQVPLVAAPPLAQ